MDNTEKKLHKYSAILGIVVGLIALVIGIWVIDAQAIASGVMVINYAFTILYLIRKIK